MNSFDDRLRAEAASYRTERAPRDLPTCPNCRNRAPSPESGAPHADYWRCTAEIVLPAFAVFGEPRRAPINLKHFDPACPIAERWNKMICPLFEQLAAQHSTELAQ